MRIIRSQDIINSLKTSILEANTLLSSEMLSLLGRMKEVETSEMGGFCLGEILDNAEIAKNEAMPLCQDTGVAVFFIEWGQECVLEGMSLRETVDSAVRQAYMEGYLRKSLVMDPLFDRSNTGDNTPAVIHLSSIPGNKIHITFLPKGAGADNCSRLKMLIPSDGREGVKHFVLQVCKEAGASSCPPWILGIGIGGTFDTVAGLAKHALTREIGATHSNRNYRQLEQEILRDVNALGIGPQGLGGKTTALAVHIEAHSCHAASLPVAVNIQCHSHRIGRVTL